MWRDQQQNRIESSCGSDEGRWKDRDTRCLSIAGCHMIAFSLYTINNLNGECCSHVLEAWLLELTVLCAKASIDPRVAVFGRFRGVRVQRIFASKLARGA